MARSDDDDLDDDEPWSDYDGKCQACDAWGPVDDISMCEDCSGKFERDTIRNRDWDYSALAFGRPEDQLEKLRSEIVAEFGEKNELIVAKTSLH